MSRIDADDCFNIDMEWYGLDKKGQIAVFCSAGEGYLPEFVCANEERADTLIEFFDKFQKYTKSTLLHEETEFSAQVAMDFSDKGLYYFDSDDGTCPGVCMLHEYYTKTSLPEKPLNYNMLPDNIKEILKYNFMDIEDFATQDKIFVQHSYKL